MPDSVFPFDFWPEHDDNPLHREDKGEVDFYAEDVDFELPHAVAIGRWLEGVARMHRKRIRQVAVIFCTDAYLHDLNVRYLQHDTLTDVITFDYSQGDHVSGDIFISIERVADNAQTLGFTFEQELHRVMAHGVLHLCGYGDKTPDEKHRMRELENEALTALQL